MSNPTGDALTADSRVSDSALATYIDDLREGSDLHRLLLELQTLRAAAPPPAPQFHPLHPVLMDFETIKQTLMPVQHNPRVATALKIIAEAFERYEQRPAAETGGSR